MVDSIIAVDTVSITGGPASIKVDVDFGPQGQRGSLILYGSGRPNDFTTNISPPPQLLDWFINLKTTDTEYLYIYQYVSEAGAVQWKRIFKIIPNVYNTNTVVNFENGVAQLSINLLNTTLILVPGQSLLDIVPNVHISLETMPTDSTVYPVASAFKISNPVIIEEQYFLPITITAAQLNASTGWEAVNGDRTAHISINVIGTGS